MPSSIPLSTALSNLRDQLRDAQLTSDPNLRLNVKEIQLELSLEFSGEISGKAGANLWKVVSTEAAGKTVTTQLHRISLSIHPEQVSKNGTRSDFYAATEPIPDND